METTRSSQKVLCVIQTLVSDFQTKVSMEAALFLYLNIEKWKQALLFAYQT